MGRGRKNRNGGASPTLIWNALCQVTIFGYFVFFTFSQRYFEVGAGLGIAGLDIGSNL